MSNDSYFTCSELSDNDLCEITAAMLKNIVPVDVIATVEFIKDIALTEHIACTKMREGRYMSYVYHDTHFRVYAPTITRAILLAYLIKYDQIPALYNRTIDNQIKRAALAIPVAQEFLAKNRGKR